MSTRNYCFCAWGTLVCEYCGPLFLYMWTVISEYGGQLFMYMWTMVSSSGNNCFCIWGPIVSEYLEQLVLCKRSNSLCAWATIFITLYWEQLYLCVGSICTFGSQELSLVKFRYSLQSKLAKITKWLAVVNIYVRYGTFLSTHSISDCSVLPNEGSSQLVHVHDAVNCISLLQRFETGSVVVVSVYEN